MGAAESGGIDDLRQDELHDEMARRRVYLHPNRWTSLGLSLIEAMMLGMPVVVVASTESAIAVPPGTGCVTTKPEELASAMLELCQDLDLARAVGEQGRAHALQRFDLKRFLRDWDAVFADVLAGTT